VAGSWYPDDMDALARQVDGFLGAADDSPPPDVAAIVVPHAGFVYSGQVAAHGFAGVRGAHFDRVLLLGPSHYSAYSGAAVPAATVYRTPLGEVAIDRHAADAVADRPSVTLDDAPFRREHSLEAEIPFLQRCLEPGWSLLPVLIGAGPQDGHTGNVAAALRPLLDQATLVVVSSDFTHFGRRFNFVPFRDDVPRRIEALDRGAIDRILAWDATGFSDYIARTAATICGRNAIDVMLRLGDAPGAADLAAYDTSGRITGDWQHSVSYASLVFRRGAV